MSRREDVEKILEIDDKQLDREWVLQPRLYFRLACDLADARKEYERAKANRDLVYAEQDHQVRLHPSNYGVDKVTETAIKSAVLKSKAYATADEDVANAKHEVDILAAAVEAVEHRKKALENRVSLLALGYRSEPREPSHSREAINNMNRQKTRKQRTREEVSGG